MMNLVEGVADEKVVSAVGYPASPNVSILASEHYAGVVLGERGQYHLVLLAEVPTAPMNWQEASAWARSIGGTLPTRQDLALLFTNCRQHFELD